MKPPKGANRILALVLAERHREVVSGDLAEIFESVILPSRSPTRAKFWYWQQVVLSTGFFLKCRMLSHQPLEGWKGRMKMIRQPECSTEYHPGIRIDKISPRGIMGLLFVFATLFIFAAGIGPVRGLFLVTSVAGILGSGIVFYWHKRHAVKVRSLNLHEDGSRDDTMNKEL